MNVKKGLTIYEQQAEKTLTRIIVSFVIFVPLFVLEHLGVFDKLPNEWILGGIYLVPYIIIGYDIVIKAARNISHGQIFDENFLMMIATFGAFGVKEFEEAVAVMLFYQVGELFRDMRLANPVSPYQR